MRKEQVPNIFSQMGVKNGDLPWVQGTKTPKNQIQDEEFDKTSSKDGAQKDGWNPVEVWM